MSHPTTIFNAVTYFFVFFLFLRFYLFTFGEREKEREKEGEEHQYVKDTSSVASHMSSTEDLAYNPSRCPENQTSDLLVHRPVLNPLSHTSQGYFTF